MITDHPGLQHGANGRRFVTARSNDLEAPPTAVAAKLVVLVGDDAGRVFPLSGEVTIGRDVGCNVVVDDDDVSRQHARIFQDDAGRFHLEDLSSRNGTFVNGTRAREQVVAFGDKIRLGHHVVLELAGRDAVEEALLERNRLEAVGRLTVGIAHDFNNMLAVVAAGLDHLASVSLPEGASEMLAESLADMKAATERATHLAHRLLKTGRKSSGIMGSIDVTAMCTEASGLVKKTFPRNIEVVLDVEPNLHIRGDEVEIHQMLMNLLVNARDAMPDGGRVSVSARASTPRTRSAERAQVVISVADTGVGIEEAALDRIFDPYFTTKRSGLGIGLASVKDIVHRHGGTISVRSRPRRGTSFAIAVAAESSIPRRQRPTADRMPACGDPVAPKRVLLTDDEDALRRAYARVLRADGYEVTEARDGKEALDLFARGDSKPDIALLDFDMPQLDGLEACRVLRSKSASLRVVMLTGHHSADVERQLLAAGAIAVLTKPVTRDKLLATVSTALMQIPEVSPNERVTV